LQKFALHTGEIAAIAFASQYTGSLLLTDDEAARRACGSLGLAVVGTIGLVLEAVRAERVDKVTALRALEALPTRGRLHITQELLTKAIAALGHQG
jgi:predicted nucleic acid-binding protein